MEHEEERVQPLFPRIAVLRMDELVFGHEQTRKYREDEIDAEPPRTRRLHLRPKQARKYRERIERMSYPFPPRQAAPPVIIKFIDRHDGSLQEPGDGKHHRFLKSAPKMVRPGPNARLTMNRPGSIAGSSNSRCQTCGSVADDMFP